jgi:ABC-type Zn uptake system ZnuABC Zn-binding protein ZnuA
MNICLNYKEKNMAKATRSMTLGLILGFIVFLTAACGGSQPEPVETQNKGAAAETPAEAEPVAETESGTEQIEDAPAEAEEHQEVEESMADEAHEHSEEAEAMAADHDDHAEAADSHDEEAHEHDQDLAALLADLQPVNLAEGEKLRVLASMSILGDLAGNVGGEAIDLSVLMPIGADAHTFDPTPRDLTMIADADVIFIVGLNAEEILMESLANAGGEAVIVPVSAGIEPREFGEEEAHAHEGEDGEHDAVEPADHDEEAHEHEEQAMAEAETGDHEADAHGEEGYAHEHEGVDPHVWTTPYHAVTIVHNIEATLATLDPAQAGVYEVNATAYVAQLEELDTWVQSQIDTIPPENRELVTDHGVFGYYADRYGLTQIGAVIPSFSTNTEPSAQDLAKLQDAIIEYEVPAIFVGTTVSPTMSQQVAQDTGKKLLTVYTGSLGPAGSGAETFIEYIQTNTNTFVEGLR